MTDAAGNAYLGQRIEDATEQLRRIADALEERNGLAIAAAEHRAPAGYPVDDLRPGPLVSPCIRCGHNQERCECPDGGDFRVDRTVDVRTDGEALADELDDKRRLEALRAEIDKDRQPSLGDVLLEHISRHRITEDEDRALHRRGLNTRSSGESIRQALAEIRGAAIPRIWRAVVDGNTCPTCATMNGLATSTAPPHPECENENGCRCVAEPLTPLTNAELVSLTPAEIERRKQQLEAAGLPIFTIVDGSEELPTLPDGTPITTRDVELIQEVELEGQKLRLREAGTSDRTAAAEGSVRLCPSCAAMARLDGHQLEEDEPPNKEGTDAD